MVEAHVEDIAMSGEGGHFVVLLRTGDGDVLPIVIDGLQAMSLLAARMEDPPERPNTHDLMVSVLDMLGASVQRVEITDLRDGTYFALLVLEKGGVSYDIDARPSDAIALAVRTGSPIYIAPRVIEQHAFSEDPLHDDAKGFEA